MLRLLRGHVLDRLGDLPGESVHCVVTSPPYYGLRSYGTEPQIWGGDPACNCGHEWGDEQSPKRKRYDSDIANSPKQQTHPASVTKDGGGAFCLHCNAWRGDLGLEPALGLYLDHMVEVFREVRRVMRKDATCWLNIGDSYSTSASGVTRGDSHQASGLTGGLSTGRHAHASTTIIDRRKASGMKPKDLMLIPSRLAIRLQDDGWWVRSDIAWCKRAPMPESCTDRPTTAWEHVFLLTKSARYFYDQEAVKEEAEYGRSTETSSWHEKADAGVAGRRLKSTTRPGNGGTRNLRNFWLLGPEPFPEAHFATFVSAIPRTAILAGTSEKGVCPKCGAPWERVTNSKTETHRKPGQYQTGRLGGDSVETKGRAGDVETETIGWQPTCTHCDAGEPVPATVLDPFLGSGTTALVADQLQRDCIGIELSPEYATMADRRVREDAGMFAALAAE